MHILDVLTICFKKKFFIAGITLVCAALAFAIASIIPKTYYTEIRLRIDDPISLKTPGSNTLSAAMGGQFSAFFGETMGNKSEELFIELLSGRDNLVSAIQNFSLDTLYKTKNMEATIKSFKKDLTISLRSSNKIITCGFKGKDRDMASGIVSFMVDNANKRFIYLQKERLAMSVEFLTERQKQLMDSLELNSGELIAFYRENNVINIEQQIELTLYTLANYEQQISTNRVGEMTSKAATGLNTPISQDFRAKNQVLQREFHKIRGQYDDTYKPSKGSVLINTDWGLDKMLFEQVSNAKINIIRDILTSLSKELAISEAQLSKNIPAVQIIQDTFYPDWKIAPKRMIWMAVSFSIAFVLSTVFVLLSAFIKGEIDGASEASRQKLVNLLKAVIK
jgi:uncharacterized protein involved in exopolysaccharide biosynthesis